MSNCCSHEIILFVNIYYALVNTCYSHQDLHYSRFQTLSPEFFFNVKTQLYIEVNAAFSCGFSAIHFRDRLIRQVSCYTILSGFRLPWPPSCCLHLPTPLEESDKPQFSELSAFLVHPTSPVLLTKSGPLCQRIILISMKNIIIEYLKFENRSKSQTLQSL